MEQKVSTYKIPKNALNAVAKREAIKKLYIVAGVFGVFFVVLLGITPASLKFIAFIELGFGLFIGFLTYAMSVPQAENRWESTIFQIGEDHVARGIDDANVSGINKFGMAVSEMRYAQASFNQFILFKDLDVITIGKNDIEIHSKDSDFTTGAGRISIPKETAGFDEIKALFLSDEKKFRVRHG